MMSDSDWLPATFSKVLHKRREALGISQEELSKRSGLHRTYISDVERGARNVSLKNMGRLSVALETTPSMLMRWAEQLHANENADFTHGLLRVSPELVPCRGSTEHLMIMDSSDDSCYAANDTN